MSKLLQNDLSPQCLRFLTQEAIECAFSSGFVMRVPGSSEVTFLPFCLFPSPFPQEWFVFAQSIQTSLNLLMYRISRNTEFLKKCLGKISETDDFVRRLLDIHETVLAEGYAQSASLGIFRMDYMLDTEGESVVGLKQVEMNTISSSSGANASAMHFIQERVLNHVKGSNINHPHPRALEELAEGLVVAWKTYGVPKSIIVFLVEKDESNFSDQRRLEYAIYKLQPGIKVLRCTFDDLHQAAELKTRMLFVGSEEVAVVYYRTGYVPGLYTSETAWSVRLLLERSKAIQCPNVALQLAGMKKVQQELTREGVLEMFLPDIPTNTVRLIKSSFVGQFSLDMDEEGETAMALALARPERYVMKPQREGGGHNVFGSEILELLTNAERPEWAKYVLMELISPPPHPNYVIRDQNPIVPVTNIVGELGIFGVILGDGENILVNKMAGHILRCKAHGENEGGIGIGVGSVNLPYLV